jgi:hypothetical protein
VCSFHPASATDLVSKGAPACTAPAVVLTVLAVPGFTETQSKERAEFGPLWHARNQHRSAGHQRTVEIERTAAELDDARAHHAQRRPPLIFVGWLTWVRALPARCNLQSFAQFISRLAVAASKPGCI